MMMAMRIKLYWKALKRMFRRVGPARSDKELDVATLRQMVHGIITTRPDEISCDECFEQLDRFVELELAGKNAAQAMPLVQDHLNRCRDCRQEFEALLTALRAIA
jgi:hypothetical protein